MTQVSPLTRKENISALLTLFPMQRGMLAMSLNQGAMYLEQLDFRIDGALDPARLEAAWQAVSDAHEALRTLFAWKRTKSPMQIVLKQVPVDFTVLDWSDRDPDPAAFEALRQADRERGFNLNHRPPTRWTLVRYAPDHHRLLWTVHHVILDGWSTGLIMAEMWRCYDGDRLQPAPRLAKYAAWLKQRPRDGAFWQNLFRAWSGKTPFPLPLKNGGTDGTDSQTHAFAIPTAATEQLVAVARGLRVTPALFLNAAWSLVLHRLAGSQQVCFGTVVAGRPTGLGDAARLTGMFTNTLPRLVDFDGLRTVTDLLDVLQEQQRETSDLEHHDLIQIGEWAGLPTGEPMFDAIVSFQNFGRATGGSGHPRDLAFSDHVAYTKNEMLLTLTAVLHDQLSFQFHHDPNRLDGEQVKAMGQALVAVLLQMIKQPEQPLSKLTLIPPVRRQIHEQRLQAGRPPVVADLVAAFAENTRLYPQAVALRARPSRLLPDGTLSYRALADSTARLAAALARHQVSRGDHVGIVTTGDGDTLVAFLAVLHLGAAYVPLDPAHPQQRLNWMAEDADVSLILAPAATAETWRPRPVLTWETLDLANETPVPAVVNHGQTTAYIMYTSGSTGQPKGVLVPHQAVMRLARNNGFLVAAPGQTIGQAANTAFDAATFEIWAALLNGATVAVPEQPVVHAAALAAFIDGYQVDIMWLTAGLFNTIVDENVQALAGLEHLLVGGEALSVAHVCKTYAHLPAIQLYNGYGPTENTTFTTVYAIPRDFPADAGSVPIGVPIGGTAVAVVDSADLPVPDGLPGELVTGGYGLALGYHRRPQLTVEKFRPLPGNTPERFYFTGDRVIRRQDGTFLFLDRLDQQVKLRGFRIELGEIVQVLQQQPEIDQALVAIDTTPGGERTLVAWLCGRRLADTHEEQALRRRLATQLPEYMIPARFQVCESFPLTANGKIDKRRLPAFDYSGQAAVGAACADDTTQRLLTGIWCNVLKLEHIGPQQNFFALGGHSLLAGQVVGRIGDTLDMHLPVRALFEYPTIAELAAHLARLERATLPPLTALPAGKPRPLSVTQSRLWFIEQMEGPGNTYHIDLCATVRGSLDRDRLQTALRHLVDKHEVLRTCMFDQDGTPILSVSEASVVPWYFERLTDLEPSAARRQARALAAAQNNQPFDLATAPLFRVALFQITEQEHLLVLIIHHIIADGWSMNVLLRDLAEAYQTQRQTTPLPLQYADYAAWQRRFLADESAVRHLNWWREHLADPPVLNLPLDFPRPAKQDHAGAMISRSLDPALFQQVQEWSRQNNATPFMVLTAAFTATLARLTNQTDLVIGTPVANRRQPETETMIGFFANTIAPRFTIKGDPSFAEWVATTRKTLLNAFAHGETPFEEVVQLVDQRDVSRSPLFDVMIAMQNGDAEALQLGDLELEAAPLPGTTSKYDLTLFATTAVDGCELAFEYATALFKPTTVTRLIDRLVFVLEQFLADPTLTLARVKLLPADEAALIDRHLRGLRQPDPKPVGLHRAFEQLSRQMPDSIALVAKDGRFTYAELEREANRLAAVLQEHGAAPGRRIGVCLPRTRSLVVSLLAVLKTGAAYVPLDPAYPSARLAFIVADARLSTVISDHFPLPAGTDLTLIDPNQRSTRSAPAPVVLADDALSHLIYTSGSTGLPKGVAIRHRAAQHMVAWSQATWTRAQLARTLAATSVCFDLSVWELFVPLSSGTTVVLVDNALSLVDCDYAQDVTAVNTVPSALNELLQLDAVPASVDLINLAGEPLERALVRRAYRQTAARQVYNLYGPSEDTTYSTAALVPDDDSPVRIGRPLAKTDAFVLDPALAAVPIGVVGELYLGGDQLAAGYLGRPDLTAERFVPHPTVAGARLYRTGDLVRLEENGELTFLGRRDHQVKLRGFRIELGEIESRLLQEPGVGRTIVRVVKDSEDQPTLAAYLQPESAEQALDETDLRRRLADQLPAYMVPGAWFILARLPLTPNGKIDVKALPRPQKTNTETAVATNDNPRRRAVAACWAAVLGLEAADIQAGDNFFALGGHSLKATRAIALLRKNHGLTLSLQAFFSATTLAETAAALEPYTTPLGPIEPVDPAGLHPMTPSQQALWTSSRHADASRAYNLVSALAISGPIDRNHLETSLKNLAARHDGLRLTFDLHEDRPVMRLTDTEVTLAVYDCRAQADPEQAAQHHIDKLSDHVFDLQNGPLFQFAWLQLAEQRGVLVLAMHHLITDGASFGVLFADWQHLYDAAVNGDNPTPRQGPTFLDYAAWLNQRLSSPATGAAFWREAMADAPEPLQLTTQRRATHQYAGAAEAFTFPAERLAELRHTARTAGTSLFTLLQAALAAYLYRWTGREDLVLGTPTTGRLHPDSAGLVGLLLNLLPLRSQPRGEIPFADFLNAVHHNTMKAFEHQLYPIEWINRDLQQAGYSARSPVSVGLTLQNMNETSLFEHPSLHFETFDSPIRYAQHDLWFLFTELPEGLYCLITYSTDLFSSELIAQAAADLEQLLRAVCADPTQTLAMLPLAEQAAEKTTDPDAFDFDF